MDDGRLAADDRDALLASMTDEVAALVLADNVDQTRALAQRPVRGRGDARGARAVRAPAGADGGCSTATLEGLPDEEEFARRRGSRASG